MFKGVQILHKVGEMGVNMKPRLIITVLALLLVAPVIANPNGPPWQNGSDLVIDTGCTCHGDGAPSTEVVISISGYKDISGTQMSINKVSNSISQYLKHVFDIGDTFPILF